MKSIKNRLVRKMVWISRKVYNPAFYFLNNIYYSFANYKVECNVCGYKSNRFISDTWHLYCTCPKCNSHVRHRLLWASLFMLEKVDGDKIIKDKSVLHFAPEKVMTKKLKQLSKKYRSADYFAEGYTYKHIDYNIDMSNMNSIPDEEYECVIACDVLEHVPDHLGALKETNRILRKGGYGIFTVPQPDGWVKTIEDLSDLSPQEREHRFAQFDHLRLYGSDFSDLLTANGFGVTIVDAHDFDNEIVKKHVLYPVIKSKHKLATNNRKVFFARKIEAPLKVI
jgi:hypothetical protein